MVLISAITVSILSITCMVSSFSEGNFPWNYAQHMRWYFTPSATASDAFSTEYERVSKSFSESFFAISSIFFLFRLKQLCVVFLQVFSHNIQISLSYGEVVEQSNLGVSEKDWDCWVSSISGLCIILSVSMLLFFRLLCLIICIFNIWILVSFVTLL